MHIVVGARYRSQVCSTEVTVVRGTPGETNLTCGGHAMIAFDSATEQGTTIRPGLNTGTQLGKRYVDATDTLEIIVTKPGEGTLCIGDDPMTMKAPKLLPSSD